MTPGSPAGSPRNERTQRAEDDRAVRSCSFWSQDLCQVRGVREITMGESTGCPLRVWTMVNV